MLFSSNVFLFAFLPITLIGYQLLSRFGRPAMMGWLAVVSLYFYSALYPPYLILLLASILFNYALSVLIQQGRAEKARSFWLIVAIVGNIGPAGVLQVPFSAAELLSQAWRAAAWLS